MVINHLIYCYLDQLQMEFIRRQFQLKNFTVPEGYAKAASLCRVNNLKKKKFKNLKKNKSN